MIKGSSIRKPLEQGSILKLYNEAENREKEYMILECIGQGGSCLVYKAKGPNPIKNGEPLIYIVKEAFPNLPYLIRSEDGHTLKHIDGYDLNGSLDLIRQRKKYEKGLKFQSYFYEKHSCEVLPRLRDLGSANNTEYYVFDYFEGKTLTGLLEDKKIKIDLHDIISIMFGICRFMDHIHHFADEGHRPGCLYLDCKPDNFYCSFEKDACPQKVFAFDFDSVTHLDDLGIERGSSYSPKWAAPEQLEKRYLEIDCTTDIYSVGLLFLWLLTKIEPDAEVLSQVRNDTFDWRENSICAAYSDEVIQRVSNTIKMLINDNISERESSLEKTVSYLETIYSDTIPMSNSKIKTIKSELEHIVSQNNNLVQSIEKLRKDYKESNNKNKNSYNIKSLNNNAKDNSFVEIATYEDLINRGFDASTIAKKLIENDKKLYTNISEINEGTTDQWAQYLSSYPETFRYLINNKNEIVGNWSFLAVSEEKHLEKIKTGELAEQSFSIDETEFLLFPGEYIGYILNFSLNEGYNNSNNIKLLFDAFADQLLAFAKNGVFFKYWYVNVFRPDHIAMYKKWGFKYYVDNKTYGKVFELSCTSIENKSLIFHNKELRQLYYDHFLQMRQMTIEDLSNERLTSISELIYDTDPYIYPALFGSRENAIKMIPDMIKNHDEMFKRDNIFVSILANEIVGLILWHKGPLIWNDKYYLASAKKNNIQESSHLKKVETEYFEHYKNVSPGTISIINVCVKKDVRGKTIGRKLFKEFINYTKSHCVSYELFVLADNSPAITIYESEGFSIVDQINGFSTDNLILPCYCMERKKEG